MNEFCRTPEEIKELPVLTGKVRALEMKANKNKIKEFVCHVDEIPEGEDTTELFLMDKISEALSDVIDDTEMVDEIATSVVLTPLEKKTPWLLTYLMEDECFYISNYDFA